jgi:hypothetical protein
MVALTLIATSAKGDEFTDALNRERAARGLRPVVSSPQLQATAYRNNQWQVVRGLGHFVLDGFGQCAATGQADYAGALDAWTRSPAHAAIIFSVDLTAVGYHQSGFCHTVSTSNAPVLTEDRANPANYYYGCAAAYGGVPVFWRDYAGQQGAMGQPLKSCEAKPAALCAQGAPVAASATTTVAAGLYCKQLAGAGPVKDGADLKQRCWPARRGLFGRLFVRLGFTLQIGN